MRRNHRARDDGGGGRGGRPWQVQGGMEALTERRGLRGQYRWSPVNFRGSTDRAHSVISGDHHMEPRGPHQGSRSEVELQPVSREKATFLVSVFKLFGLRPWILLWRGPKPVRGDLEAVATVYNSSATLDASGYSSDRWTWLFLFASFPGIRPGYA